MTYLPLHYLQAKLSAYVAFCSVLPLLILTRPSAKEEAFIRRATLIIYLAFSFISAGCYQRITSKTPSHPGFLKQLEAGKVVHLCSMSESKYSNSSLGLPLPQSQEREAGGVLLPAFPWTRTQCPAGAPDQGANATGGHVSTKTGASASSAPHPHSCL